MDLKTFPSWCGVESVGHHLHFFFFYKSSHSGEEKKIEKETFSQKWLREDGAFQSVLLNT